MVIGPTLGVIGQDSECLISPYASVKVQMCMCDCYKGIEKSCFILLVPCPYYISIWCIMEIFVGLFPNLQLTLKLTCRSSSVLTAWFKYVYIEWFWTQYSWFQKPRKLGQGRTRIICTLVTLQSLWQFSNLNFTSSVFVVFSRDFLIWSFLFLFYAFKFFLPFAYLPFATQPTPTALKHLLFIISLLWGAGWLLSYASYFCFGVNFSWNG